MGYPITMVPGLNLRPDNPTLGQVAALAGGGTCLTLLALTGIHPLVAGGLSLGLGLGGCALLGPAGIGAAIPALSLAAGPATLTTGLAWGLAGSAAAVALTLARRERRRLTTRDQRRRLRLAERDHARLCEILDRYPALQHACLALSAVRDTDHLAKVLCLETRKLIPTVHRVRVHLGVALQLSCRAAIDGEGGVCTRDPAADEHYVATEARVLTRREGDDLRVLLPLRGERRGDHGQEALCGVLDATIPPDDHDEHLRMELLRALAQLGGIGLAAVDLVAQARALALRDDLTGLFGQHEFLRRLDEQVASARRHSYPLGVVMCDLDHLKRWNDTWGHAAGDEALKVIGRIIGQLAASVPGAVACRYGGEEFALCLPGRAGDELAALIERLRIDIATATPDPTHAERRLTASFGAASLRPEENGRALLIRADAACYRAKAEGRNRVSLADDLGSVEAVTRIMPMVGRPLLTREARP
jgi:diguanylate cyclase (GGDEF)-like protein